MAQIAVKMGLDKLVPPQQHCNSWTPPSVTTIVTPVFGSASAETSGVCRPLPRSDACHDGLGQKMLSPPPPPPMKPNGSGGSRTVPGNARNESVSPHDVVMVDPGWLRSFRMEVP